MNPRSRAFRAVIGSLLITLSWSVGAQSIPHYNAEPWPQVILKIAPRGEIVVTTTTGEQIAGTVTRIGPHTLSLREAKSRAVREIGYDQIIN